MLKAQVSQLEAELANLKVPFCNILRPNYPTLPKPTLSKPSTKTNSQHFPIKTQLSNKP